MSKFVREAKGMRPQPQDDFWIAAISALSAFDYHLDGSNPEQTLSHCIRRWFHIGTRAGDAAFTVVLIGGNAVFWSHIVRKKFQ